MSSAKISAFALLLLVALTATHGRGVVSYDTGYTVSKVSSAATEEGSYVVASSYEGTLLGIGFDGSTLWENPLSGLMNYDLWTGDLSGDGSDEILAANADGAVYCLDRLGRTLWSFQPSETPMISVCVVKDRKGSQYIACGGTDLNFYWLSSDGELLKTVPSSSYESGMRPSKKWADDGTLTYNVHSVNFLRAIPQADGSDVLLMDGTLTNNTKSAMFFKFKPLASKPYKRFNTGHGYSPIGDMRVRDPDGDGTFETLVGTSATQHRITLGVYDAEKDKIRKFRLQSVKKNLGFGYRVVQTETIPDGGSFRYFVLAGEHVLLVQPSLDPKSTEVIKGTYAYNDLYKDPKTGKLILASSQSGGSCIHIVDVEKKNWKREFAQLEPPGSIRSILENTERLHSQLDEFTKPDWEPQSASTYIMSPPKGIDSVVKELKAYPDSPAFLGYAHMKGRELWDRSVLGHETWEELRDARQKYNQSHEDVVDQMVSSYSEDGFCTWGGHGTDPYFYSPETFRKVIDAGEGRQSVFIWPELTIVHKKDFPFVIDNLFAPLAEYAAENNSRVFLRNKHNFWLGDIHQPIWSRFLSGEFADVAIPSMEETADMTMELSLAGRLGVWASGSFDSWGTRCARDNPCFTRARQFGQQNLPNHFLRNAVFHVSYGAQYINNFNIKSDYSDYMQVLWELIAKSALYVPRREEIVSFSPVHLSMTEPDDRFIREGHATTTTIRYDKDFHPNNPYVIGRLDGAWPGAKTTEWDFSRYAAGVDDRRQNFLAPYSDGLVLITPPQEGAMADRGAPRGKLGDKLHPMYRDILVEHFTDGRSYFSKDGQTRYPADEYYGRVVSDIEERAKALPITVSGDVAWVVAQTAPKHLRLTLIDGGYLNPSDKVAKITFGSVEPTQLTDLLSEERVPVAGRKTVELEVPCGLFRFIDVELAEDWTGK
ncbi:PQQ-binding-like beta-propeller repeat protein [Pelagicoccus mobilis]|uniref:PQQ-binding-like beta-propeller repeat protein n=1 Tax=Pelagicoccus mobilis TaxID=415221 RepID=A0A934RY15_9BACT|nr:PQQ-binding-like beta-propeller repeat protein [Pelagicoccus mobilis]MBK1875964.1 PQQ-binding-like beta-propeller repeat protein [Pelagicoccus mobilis]